MELRLYADDRSPMGSVHRTRGDDVGLELLIADADYSGNYLVKLYQGTVGKDGVAVTEELVDVAAGSHSLTVKTPAAGTHFAYVEVHQLDSDRMAWSAPLWIVHLSETPDPPLVDDVDDGGNGGGGAGGTDDDGGEPPAGRLVINEIDYDQPGSDLGEFVEIYNGSGESVSLAGLSLVAVNGATSADYRRIDLSLGSALLGPGEYLVIGTEAVLDGRARRCRQNPAPAGVQQSAEWRPRRGGDRRHGQRRRRRRALLRRRCHRRGDRRCR